MNKYKSDFKMDTLFINDALTMYSPSFDLGKDIITPDAKKLLQNIISFMQRNPAIKIKFMEYDRFSIPNSIPTRYMPYKYYLLFFGIGKDRISAETGPCMDYRQKFCGPEAQYTRIGFQFSE